MRSSQHTDAVLVREIDPDELSKSIAAAVFAAIKPLIEQRRDGLMSREEMAEFLGISTPKVDAMVRSGELPTIRLGSRVMFDADAVLTRLRNENGGRA